MRSIAQDNLCKLKHIRTISNSIYITRSIHVWGYRSGCWNGRGRGAVWREGAGRQPKQREAGLGITMIMAVWWDAGLHFTSSTVSKR